MLRDKRAPPECARDFGEAKSFPSSRLRCGGAFSASRISLSLMGTRGPEPIGEERDAPKRFTRPAHVGVLDCRRGLLMYPRGREYIGRG
eukprot:6177054-Pleurochrysis_carterae.AAC.5